METDTQPGSKNDADSPDNRTIGATKHSSSRHSTGFHVCLILSAENPTRA